MEERVLFGVRTSLPVPQPALQLMFRANSWSNSSTWRKKTKSSEICWRTFRVKWRNRASSREKVRFSERELAHFRRRLIFPMFHVNPTVVRSLQGKLARAEEKARVAAKQAELRSKGSSIEEPAQVEALRTELAAAETKANSLQESLIAKEQESKSLKTEASFLQAKVSDLSSQLERSERAHGVLKREISIMQDGSEALEHDLEMERERNQDLQIKVEAISAAANATQQRCASLESQLTETRSELDVQRQALEAKDVALREAEVKTTHFAERLLDAESAKIKLAEQLEQLESSKYQLEQEQQKASNSLNTELAQVKQLLEISKSALKQSQTDLASTASELEVERKRTAGLVADVTSLSQALRASEEQILILEQRNQSEMTDAREALVQGQSDLMNATKVMEDMLESQNAEMARRESELLAKETELLKQEADLTLLRGSISDRTEELEARLGMVVPELTAAETRIEELKLQHEQAITDNAHLVASLRVIIQQRDDKIASLEEQVAVLHEAVALRVSELEASRREHEAVVATKDALISRGLEDKAKLEEALKGVETRAQQTEDGGARRLGELVGEIESWKKVVKELEEKVQAVHKAAAEEKRRTDLVSLFSPLLWVLQVSDIPDHVFRSFKTWKQNWRWPKERPRRGRKSWKPKSTSSSWNLWTSRPKWTSLLRRWIRGFSRFLLATEVSNFFEHFLFLYFLTCFFINRPT